MTVDGKQYVATTSGIVSGVFGGSGTSAVIVFALPYERIRPKIPACPSIDLARST